MRLARNVVARLLVASCIFLGSLPVLASDCIAMADLAYDVAKLRDTGVPIASVEARLRRDVEKRDELAMAFTVVRLVYRTEGTAQALRDAVLERCKAPTR